MYGSMYGVKKTTIYLPEELKADLERVAHEEGRSEADIVREAVATAIESRTPPRPRLPLTGEPLGDPTASERVDELLNEFGRR